MLTSAVVGLAAQGWQGAVLSGGRWGRSADGGPWSRLPALPQSVRLSGWRDVPAVMSQGRRTGTAKKEGRGGAAGVLRGRRLPALPRRRRREDEFGFGRADEPPSPPKQFADLLRQGAGLGIHGLLWCDTYTDLQRAVDRAGMRELAMRVLSR